MDVRVEHPRFVRRVLEVRMPNFGRPQVWIDYLRVGDKPGILRVQDDNGADAKIVLRRRINRFPALEIDGDRVNLGRGFAWYEWIWIALPLLLIIVGGVVGGIVGLLTTVYNTHVFRTQKTVGAAFGFSAMTTLIGVAVWFVVGHWIELLVFGPYDEARLKHFAAEENRFSSTLLDSDTRRDGARTEERSFTFDRTLLNLPAAEANDAQREALTSAVIAEACADPNVSHMIRNGVSVSYAYRSRDGESVISIPVVEADCP